MTIVEKPVITGGVETHADVRVAAALNPIGGLLGTESSPPHPPVTASSGLATSLWAGQPGWGRGHQEQLCRARPELSGGGGPSRRGRPLGPPGPAPGRQVRHPRPRAPALRSGLGALVRGSADPCFVRQDLGPLPAQPRRPPSSQSCLMAHRFLPHGVPPTDPGLRRASSQRKKGCRRRRSSVA